MTSTAADTELLFLMFPRGLITAVLAFQVLAARGQAFLLLACDGIYCGFVHEHVRCGGGGTI